MSKFITLDRSPLKFDPKLFGFEWNYYGFWQHKEVSLDLNIAVDDVYSPDPHYAIMKGPDLLFEGEIKTNTEALNLFKKLKLNIKDKVRAES